MDMTVDLLASTNSPRARTRFIEARNKAKKFIAQRRGYKPPDFARMVLDLRNVRWSHEQIAYVLGVSPSTVSSWATDESSPFYEHGEAFIQLWQEQTKLERYPKKDEWKTYRYDIGQLDFLDQLDNVIDQLDEELGA